MNERPIQKGDLVMVVRDCCGKYVGTIFTVPVIKHISLPRWMECELCKHGVSNIDFVPTERTDIFLANAPLHWLKKIDAPVIAEGVPADDEVTV